MESASRDDRAQAPRVVLAGIGKRFGAGWALDNVDFTLEEGQIHALCGENGAGKSTLMAILAGALRPDRGTVEIAGRPVALADPAAALGYGISVVYQELSLAPNLTVAENLALGREPTRLGILNRRKIRAQAPEFLARLDPGIDPATLVGSLTTGQRQIVEIARALGRKASVLVLDEPTAALSRAEAARLLDLLRDLRDQGLAIALISHHLADVFAVADCVTVLRDGRVAGHWPSSQLSPGQLAAALSGNHAATDPMPASEPLRPRPTGPVLDLEAIVGRSVRVDRLALEAGEIVGLTGLAGAGHEELARICAGAERYSGTLRLHGRPFRPRQPSDALKQGVALVPSDRRREGLIGTRGIGPNVALAALCGRRLLGWFRPAQARQIGQAAITRFQIAARGPSTNVLTLSGGNQQKVVLARAARIALEVLVLCDPTRGIDIGAREAVHQWILDQAGRGVAVLLATSDTHELARLAHRVIILRDGQPVAELVGRSIDEEAIVRSMVGTQ